MSSIKYYIYITTNLINGKKYIGKHKGLLDDDYLGSGIVLTKAIEKYGRNNFKKEILYISSSEEENCKMEQYFIKKFNATEDKNFYNIASGGQGGYATQGYSLKERQKINKKISEANSKENHPMYGKHHSEETKEKLRKASLAYWTKEKRKERSKQYMGENNPMYGKKQSLESIQKRISHTDFSVYRTKEYREKMSKATSGEKNGNYGNKDEKAKNGKQVQMYDENWNLIKIFNTKQMALKFLNIKSHDGLNRAIRQKTLYKGYYWKQN